ncbi:MAG TPA: peptidase domain-containing ABC transporter [Arsenophonus apicola]|uniref:peptidase domain-containing ABC transporter n=1 Tax=Arsenophonus apicola TaxID=2879119 RepID=UPI00387A74E8
MDENNKKTLELISIIIRLNNKININEYNKEIIQNDNFVDCTKKIQQKYQIILKQKRCHKKELSRLILPAIFYDNDNVPYILASYNDEQVLIQSAGNKPPEIWQKQDFLQRWNGNWLKINQKQSRFDIRWFVPEFLKHKQIFFEILFFSFVLQILALLSPIVIQVIMDKVLIHQAFSTLDVLIFTLIIAAFIEVILKGFREYIYIHTANRIDIRLGLKLIRHLLHLPLSFFKSRQVGAIVNRVRELETIREFLTGSMFTLLVDVLFLFVFIYVMSILSTTLTLIFLLSIPFYLLLAWKITPKIEKAAETQFMHAAINTSFLIESVAGSETIKSLAVEPRFIRRWDTQTADMVASNFQAQQINSQGSHIVMLIEKLTMAVILWIGAAEVLALNMTIGQLIAFQMMVSHSSQPLGKLVQLWGDYIRTRVAIDKLAQIINLPTEQHSEGLQPQLTGKIHFQNVDFRYQPNLPLTINQFNLSIKAGEMIGIVGTSGSGKSTLARLLLRLYTPEKGSILLDDIPLYQLNIATLRQQIGIVLQENFLFNQSVFNNIAQSKPDATLDEVIAAAKLAGAHDFILKMPLGYDSLIAEGGQSLSGGQRQRIAIARTLLSNPRILIFDEATSALDDQTQAIIQQNMQKIAQGRTVITIAHRLSTVSHHHHIIVMDQGKIIEQGSHTQLLQLKKHYHYLWSLQQSLKQQ